MSEPWRQFIDEVPWFLQSRQIHSVHAGPSWKPRSDECTALFPDLTRLLASSDVTAVVASDREYILHSWIAADGRARSWLCVPPPTQPPAEVHPHHRVLLESFGGVVERSNEPDSWLLNHNEALTATEAEHDATFIQDYAWMFEPVPGGIPIDLRAHYSIAREANGNTTLCHRTSGVVLLFAPDHSFNHVVPLDGCPEYSLYRIPEAPSFTQWVAAIARQWLVG